MLQLFDISEFVICSQTYLSKQVKILPTKMKKKIQTALSKVVILLTYLCVKCSVRNTSTLGLLMHLQVDEFNSVVITETVLKIYILECLENLSRVLPLIICIDELTGFLIREKYIHTN